MNITMRRAAAALRQADDILILTHAYPDGDALGSLFALYLLLVRMGKRVRYYTSDEPQNLTFLRVEQPPAEGFKPRFIVTVDVADRKLLGDEMNEKYGAWVDLAIDHHGSNTGYANKTLVCPEKAAACEVLYDLMRAMHEPLSPEIALRLYTGIATDTGCFRYANVTADTLRAAAALMDTGIDAVKVNNDVFETKTRQYVLFERMAMNALETFHNGQIAVMTLTQEMFRKAGVGESDVQGIKALPRMIEGVLAGFTLTEKEPGRWRVSLRSRDPVDASAVCARFGGGGHKYAAGCELEGEEQEIREKLIAAAADMLANSLKQTS
ncbi:MAG: bifunctional oligoribonuclease/PAP phosphatase NrnA [Clostridia bacterium]|nr:bifunctional oligoribonuclease/PAP phosphatase NrnA [Clostridia bacterium]